MRILGISPLDKDSTVSFVEDGRVVFACGEERLSRVKLQSGFPHRALQLGLATTGWKLSDIDIVAYAFFDAAEETRLIRRALEQDATFHRSDATAASLKSLQAARTSNYKVDRSQLIPGFTAERDEFLPTKPWLSGPSTIILPRSRLAIDWHIATILSNGHEPPSRNTSVGMMN